MLTANLTEQHNYSDAIERAAQMLIAALGDHGQPDDSVRLLETIRLRGDIIDGGRPIRRETVSAVFADLSERTTVLLSAELREADLDPHVGAEMKHTLRRLLAYVEALFHQSIV